MGMDASTPVRRHSRMKTPMSRFQIHDDLTAPEGSVPVLRGALATGGQLPNFLGVIAGSPAVLRAYARFRSELRHGRLKLDDIALAREWDSRDEHEAVLLRYLKAVVAEPGTPPMHLHEEAREAGWDDEEILEAVAYASLEAFTAWINVAGEVPADGSVEETRQLKAA